MVTAGQSVSDGSLESLRREAIRKGQLDALVGAVEASTSDLHSFCLGLAAGVAMETPALDV